MRVPFRVVFGFTLLAAGRSAAEMPTALQPEAKFLPDNCQMVGVVRVAELIGSDAYKLLEKESSLVARQQKAIAGELPLALDQIDHIVLGGTVTGEGEGLFVVHTRKPIVAKEIVWANTGFDLPVALKVGKYEMQRRRTESYCVVAPDVLVFGKDTALRAVLSRDREPTFSTFLEAALKEADLKATVAFALDVSSVRSARRGDPVPFIPGLQMALAERSADGLALSATFGKDIEVRATAVPSATADRAATNLREEATRFAAFHRTTLKERGAAEDVLNIFKLDVAADPKRVTVSTHFGPEPLAQLLKKLAQ